MAACCNTGELLAAAVGVCVVDQPFSKHATSVQTALEEALEDGNAAKGKLKAERESTALLSKARAAAVEVQFSCLVVLSQKFHGTVHAHLPSSNDARHLNRYHWWVAALTSTIDLHH